MGKIGIYTWSGIGDTMFALPLINGLKENNHEVILIGNKKTSKFFEFLKTTGQITDYISYNEHSPIDWLKNIRNLDILIFPPDYHLHRTVNTIYNVKSFIQPILYYFLNVRKLIFIEDVQIKSKSKKTPTISNAPSAYISTLERQFNIPFKTQYLFFRKDVLESGKNAIFEEMQTSNIKSGNYVVFYSFTKGKSRDMPISLFEKLLNLTLSLNLKVVFVGAPADTSRYTAYLKQIECQNNNITDLCKLSFLEVVGLFNKSKFVFSIDGGLLHFALASNSNVISFWGATIPEGFVYPDHPNNHPICRYLPNQPYRGDKGEQDVGEEAFEIPLDTLSTMVKSVL